MTHPLQHRPDTDTDTDHDHGLGHDHGSGLNAMAASATLHCLTGCAIGEIVGLVLGTALGLGNVATIPLSIALAFVFGYTLSTLPLLRSGLAVGTALGVVLAADTLSILSMEVTDNVVMALIPGAMNAGLVNVVFWVGMSISLAAAFAVAYPVNRWLLTRGKGHALTHEYHHGTGPVPAGRRWIPDLGAATLAVAIAAFVLGGLVVSAADGLESGGSGGPSTTSLGDVAARSSATGHTGADVRFARDMRAHHEQAIEMSRLADARAGSAAVRRLAASIEAAQQPEIDRMDGWLQAWGPASEAQSGAPAGAGMAGMAGMMSRADLRSLRGESGADFDRSFLRMMIDHHTGAVSMARDELARGRSAEALGTAAGIVVTQQAEVDQMRGLLG